MLQVPLKRNQLNANNSFVLREESQITVWHSTHTSYSEKQLAMALATNITEIDERSNVNIRYALITYTPLMSKNSKIKILINFTDEHD